jgi:rhodanese-related sulfurtransferase
MCAHGQRSMTAASILARARGSADGVAVFTGSAEDWARHAGRSVEQGL